MTKILVSLSSDRDDKEIDMYYDNISDSSSDSSVWLSFR